MGIELTKEQKKVVEFTEKTLIIKGTAGSGKTLVGLYRAHQMVNDRDSRLFGNDKKVIFLAYNNSLINELRDKYIDNFGNVEVNKIIFMTYDKFLYSMIKKLFLATHKGFKVSSFGREWYKRTSSYINFIKNELADTDFEYSFIKDELDYILANNFTKEEYRTVFRKNRQVRLGKNQRTKIYDTLTSYRFMLNKDKKIDGVDMYNWFLLKYLQQDSEVILKDETFYDKFCDIHSIIIDESQDLSKTKILIMLRIMEIFNEINSLTFLYDVSQTLYPNSCFGTITSFKSIGIDGRRYVKTLSFSYRSTRQIHQCAYSLLSKFQVKNDENEIMVNPVFGQSDEGIKPIVMTCSSPQEEAQAVATMIKTLLERYGYDVSDILGIIQDPTNQKMYIDALRNQNIDSVYLSKDIFYELNSKKKSVRKEYRDSIIFYNPYNVKGLEAKVIFMVGNNENIMEKTNEEIARYYYVQMTRAMELLVIMSNENPNKFIEAISKRYISEIEYKENLDFGQLIESKVQLKEDEFQKNKLERYKGIKEVTKAKIINEEKQEQKLILKEEIQEEEINQDEKKKITREECIKKVREEMPILPDKVVNEIGIGLYFYINGEKSDLETVLWRFGRGLEFTIREIFPDTAVPLGVMVHNLLDKVDYRELAQEILDKNIIKIRNTATHDVFDANGDKAVESLYKYIFEDDGIERIYKKMLKVRGHEGVKNNVERIGTLYTKGCTLKIGGKKMYSYLIDNEDYAACSKLLKKGEYIMNGRYQNSRGEKIYIINEYKLVS